MLHLKDCRVRFRMYIIFRQDFRSKMGTLIETNDFSSPAAYVILLLMGGVILMPERDALNSLVCLSI